MALDITALSTTIKMPHQHYDNQNDNKNDTISMKTFRMTIIMTQSV
jgi:hypothetical protein